MTSAMRGTTCLPLLLMLGWMMVVAGVAAASASTSSSPSSGGSVSLAAGAGAAGAGVVHLPLQRSLTSYKLRSLAAGGDPAFQRLERANAHGARLEVAHRKAGRMPLQGNAKTKGGIRPQQGRHRVRMFDAAEGPRVPADSVSPMIGCPFADFTLSLTLGVPGSSSAQEFALIADTGSSTLALASDQCGNCDGVSPVWTPSPTSSATGVGVAGSYGGHTGWVGAAWADQVSLAGVHPVSNASVILGVDRLRFAAINRQSEAGLTANGAYDARASNFFFTNPCADDAINPVRRNKIVMQGILGMGFQSLAVAGTDAFLPALFAQNPSLQPMFSMRMCTHTGSVWLGGSDPSSYIGEPLWTPLTTASSAGYWGVVPSNMFVGDQTLDLVPSDWGNSLSTPQIVDSGTTLWQLPKAIYEAVVNLIISNDAFKRHFRSSPTDNFFVHADSHCEMPLDLFSTTVEDLVRDLPTITLTFANGLTLTMDGVGSYLLPCSSLYDQWTPGIAPSSSSSIGMIAGWTFMNQFVTFHDLENMRVGFAVVDECDSGLSTPSNASVSYTTPNCVEIAGRGCVRDCAEGFYCASGGAGPVICPVGSFCIRGSTKPTPCPIGHNCPVEGLSAALPCSSGTFEPNTGAWNCSGECKPFWKANDEGSFQCDGWSKPAIAIFAIVPITVVACCLFGPVLCTKKKLRRCWRKCRSSSGSRSSRARRSSGAANTGEVARLDATGPGGDVEGVVQPSSSASPESPAFSTGLTPPPSDAVPAPAATPEQPGASPPQQRRDKAHVQPHYAAPKPRAAVAFGEVPATQQTTPSQHHPPVASPTLSMPMTSSTPSSFAAAPSVTSTSMSTSTAPAPMPVPATPVVPKVLPPLMPRSLAGLSPEQAAQVRVARLEAARLSEEVHTRVRNDVVTLILRAVFAKQFLAFKGSMMEQDAAEGRPTTDQRALMRAAHEYDRSLFEAFVSSTLHTGLQLSTSTNSFPAVGREAAGGGGGPPAIELLVLNMGVSGASAGGPTADLALAVTPGVLRATLASFARFRNMVASTPLRARAGGLSAVLSAARAVHERELEQQQQQPEGGSGPSPMHHPFSSAVGDTAATTSSSPTGRGSSHLSATFAAAARAAVASTSLGSSTAPASPSMQRVVASAAIAHEIQLELLAAVQRWYDCVTAPPCNLRLPPSHATYTRAPPLPLPTPEGQQFAAGLPASPSRPQEPERSLSPTGTQMPPPRGAHVFVAMHRADGMEPGATPASPSRLAPPTPSSSSSWSRGAGGGGGAAGAFGRTLPPLLTSPSSSQQQLYATPLSPTSFTRPPPNGEYRVAELSDTRFPDPPQQLLYDPPEPVHNPWGLPPVSAGGVQMTPLSMRRSPPMRLPTFISPLEAAAVAAPAPRMGIGSGVGRSPLPLSVTADALYGSPSLSSPSSPPRHRLPPYYYATERLGAEDARQPPRTGSVRVHVPQSLPAPSLAPSLWSPSVPRSLAYAPSHASSSQPPLFGEDYDAMMRERLDAMRSAAAAEAALPVSPLLRSLASSVRSPLHSPSSIQASTPFSQHRAAAAASPVASHTVPRPSSAAAARVPSFIPAKSPAAASVHYHPPPASRAERSLRLSFSRSESRSRSRSRSRSPSRSERRSRSPSRSRARSHHSRAPSRSRSHSRSRSQSQSRRRHRSRSHSRSRSRSRSDDSRSPSRSRRSSRRRHRSRSPSSTPPPPPPRASSMPRPSSRSNRRRSRSRSRSTSPTPTPPPAQAQARRHSSNSSSRRARSRSCSPSRSRTPPSRSRAPSSRSNRRRHNRSDSSDIDVFVD